MAGKPESPAAKRRRVIVGGDTWGNARAAGFDWRKDVEVVDNLCEFFGTPIQGRALTDS